MYMQPLPWRGSIFRPFENKFITAEDNNFGGSINFTALHQMTANGFTGYCC